MSVTTKAAHRLFWLVWAMAALFPLHSWAIMYISIDNPHDHNSIEVFFKCPKDHGGSCPIDESKSIAEVVPGRVRTFFPHNETLKQLEDHKVDKVLMTITTGNGAYCECGTFPVPLDNKYQCTVSSGGCGCQPVELERRQDLPPEGYEGDYY